LNLGIYVIDLQRVKLRRSPAITSTSELYQPARLYYDIFDRQALRKGFDQLQCMRVNDPSEPSDRPDDLDTWDWLFEHEAQQLKFKKNYWQIPRHDRPIVLAKFCLPKADPSNSDSLSQGYFDLDSFDRLTRAIAFFDQHISRDVARATSMRVVNRCFEVEELSELSDRQGEQVNQANQSDHFNFDRFFARDDINPPKATQVLSTIESIKAEHGSSAKQRELVSNYIASLEQETMPEIEELPINFYEDGEIFSTEFALKMRQKTAYERWLGNHSFNPIDAFFRKRFM
jgi:hypothetical protein